jgi:hypothetical protein
MHNQPDKLRAAHTPYNQSTFQKLQDPALAYGCMLHTITFATGTAKGGYGMTA